MSAVEVVFCIFNATPQPKPVRWEEGVLVGPGTIEVLPDGVRLSGLRRPTKLAAILAGVGAAVVVTVLYAVALMMVEGDAAFDAPTRGPFKLGAAIAIGAYLVVSWLVPRFQRSTPVAVVAPRGSVTILATGPEGCLLEVRTAGLKGLLHVKAPAGALSTALADLAAGQSV